MMSPLASRSHVLSRRAFAFGLLGAPFLARGLRAQAQPKVPILAYHRFAPTAVDSMTVRTANFESHLRVIERLDCTVIPLVDWVAWRRGERTAPLPPRAVVITADDGHRSQFEVMAPLLSARGWPVTFFVYPSAISNASYAMTWPQLADLAARPGAGVQSHTYWSPNFNQERRRLSPEAFRTFAVDQLRRSKDVIERRLSHPVSLLAWPFGIHNEELRSLAKECGYRAAFALEDRAATTTSAMEAVPRFLMVDGIGERSFERILRNAHA